VSGDGALATAVPAAAAPSFYRGKQFPTVLICFGAHWRYLVIHSLCEQNATAGALCTVVRIVLCAAEAFRTEDCPDHVAQPFFGVPKRGIRRYKPRMPSFDITSEVDKQELDNAINQARKELTTRFDFKGSTASIELDLKESKIKLAAEDLSRVKSLHDIVIGKLSKRGVDLRNVDRKDPAISPLGHATQDLVIKQGLDGDKAKEIIRAIKEKGFKVQCALQDRQIRVTAKSRDELQTVIAFCRAGDFEVGLGFGNFRE